MSKMIDLSYDIEQLYIDGHSARQIAKELECPLGVVMEWLSELNIEADVANTQHDEVYSPFNG